MYFEVCTHLRMFSFIYVCFYVFVFVFVQMSLDATVKKESILVLTDLLASAGSLVRPYVSSVIPRLLEELPVRRARVCSYLFRDAGRGRYGGWDGKERGGGVRLPLPPPSPPHSTAASQPALPPEWNLFFGIVIAVVFSRFVLSRQTVFELWLDA